MRVIGFLLATLALTTVCADQTVRITGITGTEGFNLNVSGIVIGVDPTFNVTLGETITFRIENYFVEDGRVVPFGLSTNGLGSPEDFSSSALGSLTPSASCLVNSTTLPNAYYVNQTSLEVCILTWKVVAPSTGTNFWYTSRNRVWSGVIEVLGLPTGGSGTTTNPPTGTTQPPTGTTQPPTGTTQPPTSTGKNGAAAIVPGAAAVIIAAINAIVA